MRPGLDAIRALCAALGHPERRFRAIHVAGTNGKGAVCAMLDAALRADGRRVLRYTSPHLVCLNERFSLDGAPVDDATLERLSGKVRDAIAALAGEAPGITFFEALTAVAFLLAGERPLDMAVLECGLGGRLDATNVCRPALCVITRIGLDHCDWLGTTVERIAAEKAGIVKPGVPVVLGRNERSVRDVVAARAAACGAPLFYAPDMASEDGLPRGFALRGAFNRENAVTALAALKVLSRQSAAGGGRRVTGAAVARGLSSVVWPGRFQRVGRFVVDGAHNPPAARALAAALAEEGKEVRWTLVAGFCGDKDVGEVLRLLAPHVKGGLAVRTNNPRSISADETAARMREAGISAVPCASLTEALRQSEGPTLVCGSLFLAGEALVALGACPRSGSRLDPSEILLGTPDDSLPP